jgi:hypothetical protein
VNLQSPELVDASQAIASRELAPEAASFSIDEIFTILAQCDGITDQTLDHAALAARIEASTREHLLSLPSPWRSKVGFWSRLRFGAYRSFVASKMSSAQRDVALVDYLLRNIHWGDLFSSNAQWKALKQQTMAEFNDFVTRMGGALEVERLCEAAFKRQRTLLFKDWLLRIVPTLVLISAVLIAAAMAFRFARSLTLGQ